MQQRFDLGIVSAVWCDVDGSLLVLSRGRPRLTRWSANGDFIGSLADGNMLGAHGLWGDSTGEIYGTDHENHAVYHLSPDGNFIGILGTPGIAGRTPGAPFNQPTDCCCDEHTDVLYVADGYQNTHIHGFQGTEHLLTWGERGDGPGQLILPHCIRLDRSQRLWVCDRENNRIVVYSLRGEVLFVWDDFLRPAGVWLNSDAGLVYVAELDYRMSILTMDGELAARWNTNEIGLAGTPHSISVDLCGAIYVAHTNVDGVVVKYQPINP
ncbi:MAG: hypothetical protein HPY85_03770 [Anaerolineae bacterium]|nr:hypothetical protein [Anaerolineae bacterium]